MQNNNKFFSQKKFLEQESQIQIQNQNKDKDKNKQQDNNYNFNNKSLLKNKNEIKFLINQELISRETTIETNLINITETSIFKDKEKEKDKFSKRKNSSSMEKDKEKRRSSRKNSKNSIKDSSFNKENPQSPLLALIESLKEKLKFYENETRSLVDEKIQMQMTINNLQIQQMKKTSRNLKSKENTINTTSNNNNSNISKEKEREFDNKILRISQESIFDVNNSVNKNNAYNSIIDINKINDNYNNLKRQKDLLEKNKSFLEETINTNNFNLSNEYGKRKN
jgi:hypothetical protein